MTKTIFMKGLRGGSALRTLALLGAGAGVMLASPALAQTATSAQPNPQAAATTQDDQDSEDQSGAIVVTGTLFRTTTETPSPVTVLTAGDLQDRGITSTEDAIQRLSANGSGMLPTSFGANGGFASGASAASLRGLTTSSTLVLFDGLRAAYYPLADDGTRNFVDINSIPNGIVDRIEVLKDGASSTYGADAVAGVINIITKKQITGLHMNASAGISQWGDAGEKRIDGQWGFGNLAEQGYNFYVAGEYQKNDSVYSRDRGYPYNTSDFSKLCAPSVGGGGYAAGASTCRANGVVWGTQADGTIVAGTTMIPVVRAYNATNTTAAVGSQYSILNATTGCGAAGLAPVTLTPAQAAANTIYNPNQCKQDSRALFGLIMPQQERLGGAARLTVSLGDSIQAYAAFNYYQSKTSWNGTPQAIRATTPAGGTQISTASIALPIYVCPRTAAATFVNSVPTIPGCTSANGTLNPNNPFASSGQTARILYQLSDIPVSNERFVQSYRGALGVEGSFGEGWDFSVDATAMKEQLRATYNGYIYFQHLFDVIADGSYNFVNPSANTQAVRDYLTPQRVNPSSSTMYQVQGTITHALVELPGGPLQVGVGAAWRREDVLAPSANPVVVGDTLGYQSYTGSINRFGTSGSREVLSAYFEANAPIVDQFSLNVSGRYDRYSSGQKNFSPKVGAKFTPIRQIALRSTYSRGFRIASFAEAYGLPTTGYIPGQVPPAAYAGACTAAAGTYCTDSYSIGLTSIGNPNLKPEKSQNFTAGVIIEPVRGVSISADYYAIKKTDLITGADYGPQIDAYYASHGSTTTLTPGVTAVIPDTNPPPGGGYPYPRLAFIEYGYINADSALSRGIDVDLEVDHAITDGLKLHSSLDVNYVIELSQTIGGKKLRYDDSLGAYQITSASGTPKLHGSWQNTFEFDRGAITSTINYTSGYGEEAADDAAANFVLGQCPTGPHSTPTSIQYYRDGVTPVVCRVKRFIDVDLSARFAINDQFTVYANMMNAFNVKAPYDASTYGGSNYNPAWSQAGIVGRYFRVGARVNF